METNNINKDILIKTTMWLIWDKEDDVYMLSCKAIWNRYTDGPMITLFQLNKEDDIVLSNSNSVDYCRERFVVHHQKWNLKKHHEIVLVLKEYNCYEPE